jgi:uncharacterized membrane protein
MDDRYPYIRFVIDAAHVIAGAVAAVVFLSGTVCSCGHGGFGGFISFVVTIILAAVAFVAMMVWIESLRLFVDLEETTRRAAAPPPPAPPSGTAP